MFDWLIKKLTKNYDEVPLFSITFNLNKYLKNGTKGSCDLKLHPMLKDEYIKKTLNELCDYIRNRYDMSNISK